MITKITGKLAALSDDAATLAVPPMEYEVLIAEFTRRHLQSQINGDVTLHTIHYIDGNVKSGGRLTPRLIGFLTTPERDFFELICSVSGVGVKMALRAMTQPVQDTAVMIEQQDAKGLSKLPGIGPSTAESIIAKLRRKMPKFALLVRRESPVDGVKTAEDGVVEDTFQALLALGHAESDARQLIEAALAAGAKAKDTESLIQDIYKRQFSR
jgi:Holliday junction DNA helicase RuvA